LFNGGYMQLGAVDGSGIEAFYLAANGTPASNTNTVSHRLGFQYRWNNGSVVSDFLTVEAIPIGTNGEATLRFFAPIGRSE